MKKIIKLGFPTHLAKEQFGYVILTACGIHETAGRKDSFDVLKVDCLNCRRTKHFKEIYKIQRGMK